MKALTRTCSLILATTLVLLLAPSIEASIGIEQVGVTRCSELSSESAPKKFTLYQVINDDLLSSVSESSIGLLASYIFRFDVESGKVIAKGTVLKEDGTTTSLPKLVGRMKLGDAEQVKTTDVELEVGDIIEWTIKLKNLARLQAGGDCLTVFMSVGGSDAVQAMSSFMSSKQAVRSSKD
jgi:hypothetical protein